MTSRLGRSAAGAAAIALAVVAVTLVTAETPLVRNGGAASPRFVHNQPQTDAQPDTTITIRTTGSALEFTPSRIAVKHGTNLRLRYVNDGTLPHNIVFVWDVNDIDMLGLAAYDASATGYVPVEFEEQMIAYSKLVVPGDTAEIDFVVPRPGEYTYVCLYAGHYNMMLGTLRSLR